MTKLKTSALSWSLVLYVMKIFEKVIRDELLAKCEKN